MQIQNKTARSNPPLIASHCFAFHYCLINIFLHVHHSLAIITFPLLLWRIQITLVNFLQDFVTWIRGFWDLGLLIRLVILFTLSTWFSRTLLHLFFLLFSLSLEWFYDTHHFPVNLLKIINKQDKTSFM